jgi:hypothetical protein
MLGGFEIIKLNISDRFGLETIQPLLMTQPALFR